MDLFPCAPGARGSVTLPSAGGAGEMQSWAVQGGAELARPKRVRV